MSTLVGFAYLRALAEGLDPQVAAERYLNTTGAVETRNAHRRVVEQARMAARRHGDPGWRLLGVELEQARQRPERATRSTHSTRDPFPPSHLSQSHLSPSHLSPSHLSPSHLPPSHLLPSLGQWADDNGLDGWSERELIELYEQQFGSATGPVDDAQNGARDARLRARNARLRERRLRLLRELERVAQAPAQVSDALAGWFDDTTTERLKTAGALTLGDVQRWSLQGHHWWTSIPALGPVKGRAIAASVMRLVGKPEWAIDWPRASVPGAYDGRAGVNRQLQAQALIDAKDDRAAIAAWVDARAGSERTRVSYIREAERFLLWCLIERARALSDASVEDCRAYMEFLSDVPARWVSKRKVAPHTVGWAPFAGKLSVASRRHALGVVASLFAWLTAAKYLKSDPWALVSKKVNESRDGSRRASPTSKAFTPAAWGALMAALEPPEAGARPERYPMSRERLKWLCTFCEATGLRATELLSSVRGDVLMTRAGALLSVVGKGSKHRDVPIPKVALEATRGYFALRGLDFDTTDEKTPLLASLVDGKALTYDSLYESFTWFVKRAVKGSALNAEEQRAALKASPHWLRHTHATRFAERGGDLDVLQANLGHSDPRTSARYYRAQIERRQEQVEMAFAATPIKRPSKRKAPDF